MSVPERRTMVDRGAEDLSVRRQCALLNLARSGVYRCKPVTGADDLAVMRRIGELHLELPFYGSRRMTLELNKEGRGVNRKRVRRLMRVMGLEALVPRHGASKAAPGHKIYPYLLARRVDLPAPSGLGGRHKCAAASGVRDGGRSPAIGLQERVANHRKRRRSKAGVVSVAEKALERRQVGDRKANTREPPFKCRKCSDDVETGE